MRSCMITSKAKKSMIFENFLHYSDQLYLVSAFEANCATFINCKFPSDFRALSAKIFTKNFIYCYIFKLHLSWERSFVCECCVCVSKSSKAFFQHATKSLDSLLLKANIIHFSIYLYKDDRNFFFIKSKRSCNIFLPTYFWCKNT